MQKHWHKIIYADDDKLSVISLLRMRLPSLGLGMLLGVGLSFVTSRFEEVISRSVEVAFFIPFVVYMAAALGSQTQSIYSRDLKSGHSQFLTYLVKETLVGLVIGAIMGVISFLIVFIWLESSVLATAVGLSMIGALSAAPLIAVLVTEAIQLEHKDPAVSSGPIATVIQDMASVIIYGLITSAIVLQG